MSPQLSIDELGLQDWEKVPAEALNSLASGNTWVQWALELVPEYVDLKCSQVRGGFFGEDGTPRGLIWDLLEASASARPEKLERIFKFVLRCARSDDPKLFNPATIGFLCKIAGEEAGAMSLEELAARMTHDDIECGQEIYSHHYGVAGYDRLVAVKSGRSLN